MQQPTKSLMTSSLSLTTQADIPANEQEPIFDLPSPTMGMYRHAHKDSPLTIHTVASVNLTAALPHSPVSPTHPCLDHNHTLHRQQALTKPTHDGQKVCAYLLVDDSYDRFFVQQACTKYSMSQICRQTDGSLLALNQLTIA